MRIAAQDDEINGHQIKAGGKMTMYAAIAHHSPQYWTDSEKFKPERFARERMKNRVKYSTMPFTTERRACIGGTLLQIENTLALVTLLRRFAPEYVGPTPTKIQPIVTLCPLGGLPVRIRELN